MVSIPKEERIRIIDCISEEEDNATSDYLYFQTDATNKFGQS